MLKQFLENSTLKNYDLKKLYFLIQRHGPITKNELIEKTQIKKTTLVRMLDELLKSHFIIECGHGESAVGRPPILYDVEKNNTYIIGLHISRMKTNIVLLNLKYEMVDQETFVMTSIHTPQFVMMNVKAAIQRFMDTHRFTLEELLGIGIATITPLDREEGMMLQPEDFLAGDWRNIPIVDMVKELFPVKIILEKGANAGAIAEYHAADFHYPNILYCVSGSWGMDCGVIKDGYILQDRYADATGYCHMIVDLNGRECSCGKRGCVVAYTTFNSILQELRKENALSGMMDENVLQQASFSDLMEYFKQGNTEIKQEVLNSAQYLGIGLSNLLNLFQSQVLVLNGPLIYDFPHYFEKVADHASANIPEETEVKFTQGMLKGNAPAIGGGILLFESFFNNSKF